MKVFILTIAIILSTLTVPTQKANAGVILSPSGVGVSFIIVGLVAAGGGGAPVLVINSGMRRDSSAPTNAILGALFAIGTALFIVDAEEPKVIEKDFETIPKYIFDEIEELVLMKRESGTNLDNEYVEVVFTNDEVNELYELIDDSVDYSELAQLRKILTSKIK